LKVKKKSAKQMNYEEIWKTLADLITEFRKRGETIPPDVMEDLRAAKTMIQVFKADPSHVENVPSIETYLGNVEFYLFFTGQKKFGSEFVEKWMQRLKEAREKKPEEGITKPASRFVPGLPRGERWLRVKISRETSKKEIARMAEECGLSCKAQRDGYMLVYGGGEEIKLFVKKMSGKLRSLKKQKQPQP